MIKYENHCCGCAVPAYPCIGKQCPNIDVTVYYCDSCENDTYAQYDIDGSHYCEDCAEEYVNLAFNELTLSEKAKLLNVFIKRLEE